MRTPEPLPDGLRMLAEIMDMMARGSLMYQEPQHGQPSRAYAAMDWLNKGMVRFIRPGWYEVRSRSLKHRLVSKQGDWVWYQVVSDGTRIGCQCRDDQYRAEATDTDVICFHVLTAIGAEAMRRIWGEDMIAQYMEAA